ncbi:MAG: chromate transporter [Anaeroplasmataceae bacterium]|nr:chromate transporter [Anaeroplasmataceae bacterium]
MIYLQLFLEFFKIGLFTFGGGYAMIPLIKEVVLNYGWLTEAQFMDFIGVCESTPGPIAINMATFVGSSQAGIGGAAVATIGVVLPSFIIILLVASILKRFIKNKFVDRALTGIKSVVIGLILSTGIISLIQCAGYESLTSFHTDYASIIIFVILCFIYFIYLKITKKKLNAILIILIAAGLGLAICPFI